jgi:hypothetical protein
MRQADVANGENREVEPDNPAPAPLQREHTNSHRTGAHQAKKNVEHVPPV